MEYVCLRVSAVARYLTLASDALSLHFGTIKVL